MKSVCKTFAIPMALIAAALASGCTSMAEAPTPTTSAKPVYLIASLKIADFNAYMGRYGQPVMPMLMKAGGQILVGAPAVKVLEGNYDANWTVVVRFPSEQAAMGWYTSAEYKQYIAVRLSLTDTRTGLMLLAPTFEPPKP